MASRTTPLLMSTAGNLRRREIAAGIATTYYPGTGLWYLAAGKVTNVPAAGLKFAGFVGEGKVISAADVTAGVRIVVILPEQILIPYTGAAQTDEGEFLYVDISAASNNPVDLVPAA